MSSELMAALIGALVGGGFAILGTLSATILQHWLSLREDGIKRERDAKEREAILLRMKLTDTESISNYRSVNFGKEHVFSGNIGDIGGNIIILVQDDEQEAAENDNKPASKSEAVSE
jgi:hypothetical protein